MVIDHLFFISHNMGAEAEAWTASGWKEGSRRTHTGQGTANRKFYVQNCFFEFLWIDDPVVFQSSKIQATGLPNRFSQSEELGSNLGLCIENNAETQALFAQARSYQPAYFPEGQAIRIIADPVYPDLPWLFCLPFPRKRYLGIEPMDHPNGIEKLTSVQLGVTAETLSSPVVAELNRLRGLECLDSKDITTKLIFDNRRQGKSKQFESLRLVIEY
ncbi:MAG: hypothetical protein AAGH79_02080 [Bacteroidota bacterium]